MKKKLKKIPIFKNEDEERAFWAKADTSEYFDWDKAEPVIFPNLKPSSNNDLPTLAGRIVGRNQSSVKST